MKALVERKLPFDKMVENLKGSITRKFIFFCVFCFLIGYASAGTNKNQNGVDDTTTPQDPHYWTPGNSLPKNEKCPYGSFRDENICRPCPRGTYGPSNDLTSSDDCSKCDVGTYNDKVGMPAKADCKLCPAGTYGSTKGLTTRWCSGYCDVGTYSLEEGLERSSDCEDCPKLYWNWQCRNSKEGRYNLPFQ
mmetsp:Transcript_42441/g.66393  ORF Transcript_42441/g.66393 Transcript_42441/m.66393 type:complete len:191 (+) Transcript_42441:98-670(+)